MPSRVPADRQPSGQTSSSLRPAAIAPRLSDIDQVHWQAPETIAQQGEILIPPPSADSRKPDFFSDPFGDDPLTPEKLVDPPPFDPPAAPRGEQLIPPPVEPEPAAPEIPNELRSPAPQRPNMFERTPVPRPDSVQPRVQPRVEPKVQPRTDPQPPAISPAPNETPSEIEFLQPPLDTTAPEPKPAPSLGERLRNERPLDQSTETLPPPLQDGVEADKEENPFGDFDFGNERDRKDKDRLNSGKNDAGDVGGLLDDDGIERPKQPSCEDFRQRIAAQTIEQVSLDISPPYRPDEIDLEKYAELKEEFDEKQESRQWRAIDGTPMAAGRLRDLAYEKAIVESDQGIRQELPLNRLSEADRAYIAENWGLPSECLLEQTSPKPRNWAMTTMTWKASNLCHTPLYFEDVNLERYGHTHGPILEPLVQSAHFFGNVLVLPYKMGVHSPHECQYPLGYYRPGNCAPWIRQPVPISAKGALTQAVTMTGLFWLVP